MEIKERNYILLVLIHIALGIVVFTFPILSKIYCLLIIIGGFFYVIKNKNKNNEVLIVSAYIVGIEVFLRMTGGNILYEFSKYGVIFFLIVGMYYSGFSKYAVPYWIFLLLLIPGIIVATETLNLGTDIRKPIAFNISGPVCLGIASLYTYNRKILFSSLNTILLSLSLPVITTTVYLILYTPSIKDVVTGTSSNFESSGGFGPNQVSTILGIGMFVFFSRLLLESKSKLLFIINLIIAFNISYRGLTTFSRGGMITGLVMIIILIFFLNRRIKYHGKVKLNFLILLMTILLVFVWIYSSNQTGGLIEKRYANQDASGRVKESRFTGREEILENEFQAFLDNPIFGIGVAKGIELRYEQTGDFSASHNEITRMMSEHGTLGIIALLIIFITPMILYLDNAQNIYMFCFLIFWLLTINHAAMRIAAPAFVYSLTLLKVKIDD